MEVTRTIQEISRVLKPNGRFVCLSNADNYKNEKVFFDFLDIPESEYRSLYRKARLYSGLDDLVELSKEHNLSLSQHKTFEFTLGDTSHQKQVILSVFIKLAVKK